MVNTCITCSRTPLDNHQILLYNYVYQYYLIHNNYTELEKGRMDYLEDYKSNCFSNLTLDEAYSSFALSGLCAISFIISIPAVILGVHEYCIKGNLSDLRTERLLLYLASGSCIASFIGCFQWISHYSLEYCLAEVGCAILGFFFFAVAIFVFVITFFIGIHFLVQICRPKLLRVPRDELLRTSKRMEIAYVSVALLLSIFFSPWPFINNIFGYNLWICWLKTTSYDCTSIAVGSVMVTTFYAATVGILIFSFCVVVSVQILIYIRKHIAPYHYVWAFIFYLVISILIFSVTMIVNFMHPKTVPSALHGIKIFAIGLIPFTASLVTLIVVSYKKWTDRHSSLSQPPVCHNGYGSTNVGEKTSAALDSKASTTFWISPRTEEIMSTD